MMRRGLVRCCILLAIAQLGACGGNKNVDLSCDKPRFYQHAEDGTRIEVPEDLDPLDELREMPLPEAAPRPARPPGSPCVDRPPGVRLTEDDDEASE